MAVKIKPRVAPAIKTVPAVKILTRGTSAGEAVATMGADADTTNIANFGVQRGLLKEVAVYGMRSGIAIETFTMTFSPDNSGEVLVEDDETKSMLGRIDGGMERAVALFAGRLKDKGLTPDFYFVFHDHIYADPNLLANARRELGLSGTPPPPMPSGCTQHKLLGLTCGRDTGQSIAISRAMRPRTGARS